MEITKEMLEYDIGKLEAGIERARKNIETFEQAIEKEHTTIRKYKAIINFLKERNGDKLQHPR